MCVKSCIVLELNTQTNVRPGSKRPVTYSCGRPTTRRCMTSSPPRCRVFATSDACRVRRLTITREKHTGWGADFQAFSASHWLWPLRKHGIYQSNKENSGGAVASRDPFILSRDSFASVRKLVDARGSRAVICRS